MCDYDLRSREPSVNGSLTVGRVPMLKALTGN
jgi:hypothetical protein